MNKVSELIKAAKGEPLFKGDLVGHEFHGNQYAASVKASGDAREASSKANRTDDKGEHARAGRLRWTAARLAMDDGTRQEHIREARAHDARADK